MGSLTNVPGTWQCDNDCAVREREGREGRRVEDEAMRWTQGNATCLDRMARLLKKGALMRGCVRDAPAKWRARTWDTQFLYGWEDW